MKLLVQIRGANGAGKSTVPMSMQDDPNMYEVGIGAVNPRTQKPGAPFLTVFPKYGWVALGTYHGKTGGMDTFSNNAETFQAFDYAWREYPEYHVLMEGVIASTIKSTYATLFQDYQDMVDKIEINHRKIIIMSFTPPIEVCLARVQLRNGGKPVNEDAIASKWRTVDRNVQYFKDLGFVSLRIDTSRARQDQMLNKFLHTCAQYNKGGL